MKKAGIIGHPVSHSLSPLLHEYWIKKYGLKAEYLYLDTEEENLGNRIGELRTSGFVGANITVPYKEKVMKHLDEISDEAKKIGAVNTILVKEGRLFGINTDTEGFLENIRETIPGFSFERRRAVILGAGGAARAVIYSLLKEGAGEIWLVNRTKEKAEMLAQEFGNNIHVETWGRLNKTLGGADILINTTSLGMKGKGKLEIDISPLPKKSIVYDIVYNPLETELLKQAKFQGNKVVDGLGMLLYQAVPAFHLWFGIKPKVTGELRKLIASRV